MRRYVVIEPDIYIKLTEKPVREIKKTRRNSFNRLRP